MKIAVIIPNYNGEELLKKNLPHVLDALVYSETKAGYHWEIIIVDDFSSDNSVSYIESLIVSKKHTNKKITLVKNNRNYGFSTTVNNGVKKTKADIVVLLNTDVRPEKEFLLPLLRHFSNENIFAVGCMDKSIEGGKIVLRGRGIGKWERGFMTHAAGALDKTNSLWASGGSSAYRKSIWDKLGGMNELYNPFYWEDIDLSYRARKSGYTVLFEKESIVTHEHEKGAIKKKYSAQQIKINAYRNQILFVWCNITQPSLLFSHFFWLPYHVVSAISRGNTLFLYGLFRALLFFPRVLAVRQITGKHFVKTDKSLQIFY